MCHLRHLEVVQKRVNWQKLLFNYLLWNLLAFFTVYVCLQWVFWTSDPKPQCIAVKMLILLFPFSCSGHNGEPGHIKKWRPLQIHFSMPRIHRRASDDFLLLLSQEGSEAWKASVLWTILERLCACVAVRVWQLVSVHLLGDPKSSSSLSFCVV